MTLPVPADDWTFEVAQQGSERPVRNRGVGLYQSG